MSLATKKVKVKLVKGLLDLIVLQLLNGQPMHGYHLIKLIRKRFGVYFGPSTVYPLLGTLEKKRCIAGEWEMTSDRPRKIYSLTGEGKGLLNFAENSLHLICRKIGTANASVIDAKPTTAGISVFVP